MHPRSIEGGYDIEHQRRKITLLTAREGVWGSWWASWASWCEELELRRPVIFDIECDPFIGRSCRVAFYGADRGESMTEPVRLI